MRTWLDRQEERWERRMQLLRGRWNRWRGARTGRRFGVGQDVRILYPSCLRTGDDVTLCDCSYLHCLSERGVYIGSHTSIDRNLWLHCAGTPADHQHGYFEIGEHSYIGCNAVIGAGGGIRIGQHVLIGQGVHIHAENHSFGDAQRRIDEQGVTYQEVVIEDDVWIGSRAMILAGVTIGRGAVIGGGAVVTTSVPPYSIAVGVPARLIGQRGGTA
jgi:carbonic anhydrase/acetyltransferase-like protein (isoleucine patch superfamily)